MNYSAYFAAVKILSTQALRGPNYWSNLKTKLIQVRVELVNNEIFSPLFEDKINSTFKEYLIDFLIKEGNSNNEKTLQLFSSIGLALQNATSKNNLAFWGCKKTKYPNIYIVYFEYKTEQLGKESAKKAAAILEDLLANKDINFEKIISELSSVFEKEKQDEKLNLLIDQAEKLNIPTINSDEDYPFQFGYGKSGIEAINADKYVQIEKDFREKKDFRIPIIAITGSNGKTTTTRLIAHIISQNNLCVGFTTSDGIYINHKIVDKGDTTGPKSAEMILRSPLVEVAVLETARGGIVRAGLGFDICDIAVITNVQEDHLGISDIETMEDLAQVKSVVVNAIKKDGVAILNADNAYTLNIGRNAKCNVAWFSMDAHNPIILSKLEANGSCCYIENDEIFFQDKTKKTSIIKVKDVPITFGGKLNFMTQNALAATLAAMHFGISPEFISQGLKTFIPSPEQTPGRMNIFDVGNHKVLVDFAHNQDGFSGIRDFLSTVSATKKIGIIVGTGDRKTSDTIELGKISAAMFDVILIHQVKFLRGKQAEEIVAELVEGILQQNPNAKWERVADEIEPLGYALSIAPQGSFITALSDVLVSPIELIDNYKIKI